MSLLEQVKKPVSKPPMITIVGSAGVGKTSLAGLFPDSLFVSLEDGTTVFESWNDDVKPQILDLSQSKSIQSDLLALVKELGTSEHNFKTVVFDSITTLNLMLELEMCKEQGVADVASAHGGYFRGFSVIADQHKKFIGWCDHLRKVKNMAVVFLSHVEIEKIKNSPEESSEYAVFAIGMYKKSSAMYRNFCDGVYYLTKEKFIVGAETNRKTGATTKFGRATETGKRILVTNGDGKTGYIDCKDRYGLPSEIEVEHGTNPLLTHIKFFNSQA